MSGFDEQSLRRLRTNELMSRHTSWRVGGPADRFYKPNNIEDLKSFLSKLDENEPVTWIGLGSNLLVRDGGIRGTVIATKSMDDGLEQVSESEIYAAAGISCARIAKASVKYGMTGAEFLIGIPGTLGGALAMNAGAFGSETWDVVDTVTTITRGGREITRKKDEFSVSYRSVSIAEGEWFISAMLKLNQGEKENGKRTIKDLLNRRSESQPIGEASCGSVFKNPDSGKPAAKLIEECGLKGTSIGGAAVSDKHANFIINTGSATASDIENLIANIQSRVFEKFNIKLVPEVRVIGEKTERSGSSDA